MADALEVAERELEGFYLSGLGVAAQSYESNGAVVWDERRCEEAHRRLRAPRHLALVRADERVRVVLGQLDPEQRRVLQLGFTSFAGVSTTLKGDDGGTVTLRTWNAFRARHGHLLVLALAGPLVRDACRKAHGIEGDPSPEQQVRFLNKRIADGASARPFADEAQRRRDVVVAAYDVLRAERARAARDAENQAADEAWAAVERMREARAAKRGAPRAQFTREEAEQIAELVAAGAR